jgi:lipopolysaccharide assembly outer membrane protein LptD (OstA)
MKALPERHWLLLMSMWLLARSATSAFGQAQNIEDLRLPIELYDDGRVKIQVVAALANIAENGDVTASEVRIEFYDTLGKIENLIQAEDCVYRRDKGKASSRTRVRLQRKGLLIDGTGFDWNAQEQSIRILDDVRVVLRGSALKLKRKTDTADEAKDDS